MNTHRIFIFFVMFFLGGQCVWASEQGGTAKAVLMPISAPFTQEENARLAEGVAEGLASRYEVLHGQEVDGVVKRIFDEENNSLNCDLDICYQKIARHFGVEFIVAFVVAKKGDGGMGLSLSVLNVLENKVVLKRRAVSKSSRFDDVLEAGVALAKGGGS